MAAKVESTTAHAAADRLNVFITGFLELKHASVSDRAASAGHGFMRREPARKSQPRKVGGSGSGPVLRPARMAVRGQNAAVIGIARASDGA